MGATKASCASPFSCVNMDGTDKRVPLVNGKSARPRSFKNAAKIPVKYVSNAKAWMTHSQFVE